MVNASSKLATGPRPAFKPCSSDCSGEDGMAPQSSLKSVSARALAVMAVKCSSNFLFYDIAIVFDNRESQSMNLRSAFLRFFII